MLFGRPRTIVPMNNKKRGCGVDAERETQDGSCKLSENLEMWRIAKSYYADKGWVHLAKAAERQIERITDQKARDYINGRSSCLLGN